MTAVDLGPDTEAIIAYAAWLAGMVGSGASLMLLHIMDYTRTPTTYLARYIEDEKKQNLAVLMDSQLRCEQNVAVGNEVIMGRLIELIAAHSPC